METKENTPHFRVLVDNPEEPSPLSILPDVEEEDKELSIGEPPASTFQPDGLEVYFAQSLDKPRHRIIQDLNNGQRPTLDYEATTESERMRRERARETASRLLSERPDIEGAEQIAGEITDRLFFWQHLAPEVGPLLEGAPEIKAMEARRLDTLFAAQRLIHGRLADQPWYKDLGDFGDLALTSGFQNIIGTFTDEVGNLDFEGAPQLRELAREASDLLVRDLPKEEFETRFNEILDRISDAGFFTEDNLWYVAGFLQLVSEGGEGFDSKLESLFQTVDLGFAGLNVGHWAYKGIRAASLVATLKDFRKAVDSTVEVVEGGAEAVAAEAGEVGILRLPDTSMVSPDLQVRRQLERNNAALRIVRDSNWGKLLTEEQFAGKVEEWRAILKAENEKFAAATPDINYYVDYGPMNNIIGGVVLGKSGGGEGWKVLRFAEEFANKNGGEVFEAMVEGQRRYFVRKEVNIPTEGLADALNLKDVATGFFSHVFSTTYREPAEIDSLARRGEAQASRQLRVMGQEYKQLRRKAGERNVGLVNGILKELRDDPNFHQALPYTSSEFTQRFYEKYGEFPDQNTLDYYKKLVEINDVDYFINADVILKEAVNNGEEMVRINGDYYWGKRVENPTASFTPPEVEDGYVRMYHGGALKGDVATLENNFTTSLDQARSYAHDGTVYFVDVPKTHESLSYLAANDFYEGLNLSTRLDPEEFGGAKVLSDGAESSTSDITVFDPESGRLRLRTESDSVYEIKNYEYAPEGIGAVKYVAFSGTPVTRRLYHSDVLGYNPGGHRTIDGVYDFFIKQDKTMTLATGESVSASPTTFLATRTEAEASRAVAQINRIVDAINVGDDLEYVNSVIRANNEWNVRIEDFDDFRNFMAKYNADFTKRVLMVEDKGLTEAQKASMKAGKSSFYHSGTATAKGRKEIPIAKFGGDDISSLDPTTAIERGFAQAVARKGSQVYNFRAINSWVNAAKANREIVRNYPDVASLPAKQFFEKAEFGEGLSKAARALEKQRKTIHFRLSNTTSRVAQETHVLRRIAEAVYNKGWKKLAKAFDWMSTKDPIGFFRAMAFHTKLGMFNPDQIYVQGNQLMNIAGIGAASVGPVKTMRAMLAVTPLRLALVKQIPDESLKRIAKLQANFTGISADDFIALRDWLDRTGMALVDRTVVEENNAVASLGPGMGLFAKGKDVGGRVLDAGQVFFREGETLGRLGAAALNLVERRAKYGMEDIFDDRITDAMVRRQNILTAQMTSASAAPWQKSALALPLQFMTYNVRMIEQIFTDRILSPKERLSLGLTHLFVYGAAGVPAAGWLAEKYGYETGAFEGNEELFNVLRYGALDAILSGLTGEETALSSRLGVGDGLWDTLQATGEDTIWETAVGPGGTISIEFSVAFASMMENIFTGNFNHLTYDWNRMARNVSSYDKAFKFWAAQRYGQLLTRKTESLIRDDLSGMETFLATAGIPMKEEDQVWSSFKVLKREDREFSKLIGEMKRLDAIATRLVKDGDPEGASLIIRDMGALLALLTPTEYDTMMAVLKNDLSMHEAVIDDMLERGKMHTANYLHGVANGNP